jgi:hypothetical protein
MRPLLLLGLLLLRPATGALPQRKVFAWAGTSNATVAQLTNASWRGIFDGVHAGCGVRIEAAAEAVTMVANETVFGECAALKAAVEASGGEFHVWTNGVPQSLLDTPSLRAAFITSAIEVAHKHGIKGFSIDDETDCAPRSTLKNFTAWVGFINQFADSLHAASPPIQLSAAVQAMFGIEDVEYQPLCSPPASAGCSQACSRAPWGYNTSAKATVGELMSNSSMDRWLEMDTYYFGTARYLDALDWYTSAASLDSLGVAVMNRKDITNEGYLARFHALDRSGADWLNLFMLPAADEWLPYLRRWKTRCSGCKNRGSLSCYEMQLPCDDEQSGER